MSRHIAGAMLAAIAVVVLGFASGANAAPRFAPGALDYYNAYGAVPGPLSPDFYDHAKGNIKDN